MTTDAAFVPRVPSASQRLAIEADARPLLVLAGPGAGKTFCLIERIAFLIDKLDVKPERICVFTFTNKAAGEIAERLTRELGPRVERVKRGTIHAFCAELLREFGEQVGLQPGFGIADEPYQRSVLRRLRVPTKMHKSVLDAFARHRFRGEQMSRKYQKYYDGYRQIIGERNVADFDTLVLKTAELLRIATVSAEVRSRWDAVLVDEFQDLNPIQYAVIRELARDHRHLFVVGDDEQSVYSWTGADPKVFLDFRRDFGIASEDVIHLRDNYRCPPAVMTFARRLIAINESIFANREAQATTRDSQFAVTARNFADDAAETKWIIEDLLRDRSEDLLRGRSANEPVLSWGDVALLYRTHKIGSALETAFLNAGIPCRLAQGRALSDDKVVAYVLAALRVIANPHDEIQQELFYQTVLPEALFDSARAWAEETGRGLVQQLEHMARTLPREHGDAKKIWRGFYALQNLDALGKSHSSLQPLVDAILSEKVGTYRTILEEHQEDLSDPASHEEVVGAAERIQRCIDEGRPVWVPRSGGAEIAAKKMLTEMGVRSVELGGAPSVGTPAHQAGGFPIAWIRARTFQDRAANAHQIVRQHVSRFHGGGSRDDRQGSADRGDRRDRRGARSRWQDRGRVSDARESRASPLPPGRGTRTGSPRSDVADAPYFEEMWPAFRDFCGSDVLVAHNGYEFDFPILRRMATNLPRGTDFSTYDTLPLARTLHATSRRLEHLAKRYDIPTGQSHRALDDCRVLAKLFPMLSETRLEYARKTAFVNLLDQLGIALALSDRESWCDEARKIFEFVPVYSLGRHSDCLDRYESERGVSGDPTLPTVDDLIALLGGHQLMERLRSERSADKRYPEIMGRLRRLIEGCGGG